MIDDKLQPQANDNPAAPITPATNPATTAPTVSVIVPVYKAETYIRRCLDSLAAQTLTDFEVLLVDDGSPDGSGAICDEYAARDPRFRVFHKANGGVASARQYGLDRARGEYVTHADPDDWAAPRMLEAMVARARETGADMVVTDYIEEVSPGVSRPIHVVCPDVTPEALLRELLMQRVFGASWNKLLRRSFVLSHHVAYEPGMSLCEDLYFNCRFLLHGPVIAFLAEPCYHYDLYSNGNTLTRKASPKDLHSMIRVIALLEGRVDPQLRLDPQAYAEELYHIKETSKERAAEAGLLSEARDLCPEVNDEYLRRNERCLFPLYRLQLCLLLRGHAGLAALAGRLRRLQSLKILKKLLTR